MIKEALAYVASALVFVWGIGHLIPTRSVVRGFGELTTDNRRIITMEWVAEGLTLCFLGVLAALVVLTDGFDHSVGRTVLRAIAAMLFVMAGLTAATGAKTSIGPMKACPIVKAIGSGLLLAAVGMH